MSYVDGGDTYAVANKLPYTQPGAETVRIMAG